METRILYPLIGTPAKPKEPIPPSKMQELHYDFEELIKKFIDEHEYVFKSDYESNFITFRHAEEFFAWLSKLAAEEKLSLKFEWESDGSILDVDLYLKIDNDQYESAKENYENQLKKYQKDLEEYDAKYLSVIRNNISSLEDKILSLKKQEQDLLKK